MPTIIAVCVPVLAPNWVEAVTLRRTGAMPVTAWMSDWKSDAVRWTPDQSSAERRIGAACLLLTTGNVEEEEEDPDPEEDSKETQVF